MKNEKMAGAIAGAVMKSKGNLLITLCMCAITPLIISATYAGLYLGLGATAAKYNEDFGCGDVRCFDMCSTASSLGSAFSSAFSGSSVDMGGLGTDTAWTLVYGFNGGVYMSLTILTLCLVCSALIGPLAFCGACLIGCAQCGHLAALIVTGVLRYSDDGKACADNPTPVNADVTFADIGSMMEGIFISQCILYCFYGCCLGALTQFSVMVYMGRKAMGG